jgi:hypothetical protein
MLDLFIKIGYLVLGLNFVVFAMCFSNQGKAYRIFTVYIAVIGVIQIASRVLSSLGMGNLFLSHFYFIVQFIILSFFYLELLKEKYQRKIIKLALILVLSFLGIQYAINPKLFFEFNLFEIFITSFSIIIFSAFHFYNMLNEKKEFYYINMGILLYLFGSTILFLVGNLTVTLSREFTKIPWILNALFYVFYQLFVLFEWKKSFSKKELGTNL